MSKQLTLPAELAPQARSFYRPHKRVTVDPHIYDPGTGEATIPVCRVKQSHVAECDINNIIKSFSVTGQFTHINANAKQGAYLDLPDDMDFQAALALVERSEAAFATLPAHTRDRFGNDPAQFLDFMSNPSNQDEAIKLGLATDRRPPPDPKPPVTTGDLVLKD